MKLQFDYFDSLSSSAIYVFPIAVVQGVGEREGRKVVMVADQGKFHWSLSSSAPVFSPYCSGRFRGNG